jgi:hypothetical protein
MFISKFCMLPVDWKMPTSAEQVKQFTEVFPKVKLKVAPNSPFCLFHTWLRKALVVIIGDRAAQPTSPAFAIEPHLYELIVRELRPILVILILYHLPQPTPDQLLGLEMEKE